MHRDPASWRAGQVYLALLAVVAIVAAVWSQAYWNRKETPRGSTRQRVAEQLPAVAKQTVARRGAAGALEVPAMALWVHAPIALPAVAVACALVLVGLRRRRRWALAATLLVALLAPLVVYGGARALHDLEDRRFYSRSPYVRTYRWLGGPLVGGSAALLVVLAVDAVRRRRTARTTGTGRDEPGTAD